MLMCGWSVFNAAFNASGETGNARKHDGIFQTREVTV